MEMSHTLTPLTRSLPDYSIVAQSRSSDSQECDFDQSVDLTRHGGSHYSGNGKIYLNLSAVDCQLHINMNVHLIFYVPVRCGRSHCGCHIVLNKMTTMQRVVARRWCSKRSSLVGWRMWKHI
jgi:hypothetical protein